MHHAPKSIELFEWFGRNCESTGMPMVSHTAASASHATNFRCLLLRNVAIPNPVLLVTQRPE